MPIQTREYVGEPPLHPLLVLFPLGFAVAALASDVYGFAYHSAEAWTAGYYLAISSFGAGAVAAVPTLLDLVDALQGTNKRLAVVHGILHGSALLLLLASWLLRDAPGGAPSAVAVTLEGLACFALLYGGLIGHALLHEGGLRGRRRYAQLAKSSSVELEPSDKPVRVAAIDELKINQMRLVRLGERRIVVARTDRGICAFDDSCSHQGGSLAEGVMLACTVLCPWHGSKFDALTGQVKSGPARRPLRVYRVEVRGKDVYLHPQALPEPDELPRAANV